MGASFFLGQVAFTLGFDHGFDVNVAGKLKAVDLLRYPIGHHVV